MLGDHERSKEETQIHVEMKHPNANTDWNDYTTLRNLSTKCMYLAMYKVCTGVGGKMVTQRFVRLYVEIICDMWGSRKTCQRGSNSDIYLVDGRGWIQMPL